MSDAISQKTARQIVEAVKDVCGYDINFIRPDGIIEASTDPARVGTFHEVGQMAARTGKTLEVSADDPLSGTRRGINLPFVFRGETVAVIGISGDPEEVRKFATLAQKITFLLLREREINLESRNRQAEDAYVIRALTQGEAISSSYIRYFLIARGLSETALCRPVVIRLSSRWNPAKLSMTTVPEAGREQPLHLPLSQRVRPNSGRGRIPEVRSRLSGACFLLSGGPLCRRGEQGAPAAAAALL